MIRTLIHTHTHTPSWGLRGIFSDSLDKDFLGHQQKKIILTTVFTQLISAGQFSVSGSFPPSWLLKPSMIQDLCLCLLAPPAVPSTELQVHLTAIGSCWWEWIVTLLHWQSKYLIWQDEPLLLINSLMKHTNCLVLVSYLLVISTLNLTLCWKDNWSFIKPFFLHLLPVS